MATPQVAQHSPQSQTLEAEVIQDTAIERASLGPIGLSPRNVISEATEMANALAEVIHTQHLYSIINGKKYVLCEGWTTLGAMLGIVTVEDYVKEIPNGFEARVRLTKVRDGAIVGGASAICTHEEPTWATRAPYALRSMSLTRATSKAFRLAFSWIMKLAGFEATPAEEMVSDEMRGSKEAAQDVAKRKIAAANGNGHTDLSDQLQASIDSRKPVNLPPLPEPQVITSADETELYVERLGISLMLTGATYPLRKTIKDIFLGSYDKSKKQWEIDAKHYEALAGVCKKAGIRLICVGAAA